jgi:hypothetical protein
VERVVLAVAGVVVAAMVAWVLQRRRPAPPTQGRWPVPTQLDRADFDRPDAPWFVAVFSSATCESCEKAVTQAMVLESAEVAVQEVEAGARRDLHDRYFIEAVPVTVVADADGVVRASFVGPPSAADLWAAVAECRDAPS